MADPAEMPATESAPAAEAMPEGERKPDKGSVVMEVTLCLYKDGKLAVKVDEGEKYPAKDLDTAMSAMRQLIETEMGEGSGKPEQMEPKPEEAGEEQAFQAGYAQP